MSQQQNLSMLERRRIEATILKHVYDTLKQGYGKDVAAKVIGDAVRCASIEQGAQMRSEDGNKTSLQTFIDRQELWTRGNALAIDVKEQSSEKFVFHVTRCEYARMYKEMGLGEIGHLLSCQRDGTFCEGYDAKLKLKRTQTIMQGASHCDFEYTYAEGKPQGSR
jgi:imidazole glycerol phosphate synthase subunit HisF